MSTSRNDDWRDCHDCGKAYSLRQRGGKMVCIFCHPSEQINAAPPDLEKGDVGPAQAVSQANPSTAASHAVSIPAGVAPTLADMLT